MLITIGEVSAGSRRAPMEWDRFLTPDELCARPEDASV